MVANPDIKIVVDVKTGTDITTAVEMDFMVGQKPDLVFSDFRAKIRANWLDQGVIIPLNDYITGWGFEGKFIDNGIQNWNDESGNLLTFSLEGFTWPFRYNTKIFTELNLPIPATWDEIIANTPAIKATGYEVVAAGANENSGETIFGGFLANSMPPEIWSKMCLEGHCADYQNAVAAV